MKTDSQIQADVIDELTWNPSVTHEHLGVAVRDGIVTLTGTVPTYLEKSEAEKCAQRVSGVKAIVEKIEVDLPALHVRDDQDIAEAIVTAFRWNVQIPDERVKVKVVRGWVTLSGEVAWEYERSAANTVVRTISGVTGISDNIAIQPAVRPAAIKEKIEQALQRAAEREAHRIEVAVEGGRVVLSGKVRSFAELQDARGAAWGAPGVTDVQTKLQVAA